MSQINIEDCLREHRRAVDAVAAMGSEIAAAAEMLKRTFKSRGRVFICGNGGSAADAQHFAAELTGRFNRDRKGYPVVALTTDTSALTAIGNDYGFERIFARQLEALAGAGDLLIVISTSGNSPNIVHAMEAARACSLSTIGLFGRDGGELAGCADLSLVVPVQSTARIQEAHIIILHLLCESFEI